MRFESARPRALSRSLSPVELVTAKTVGQQICENDLQSTVLTDFGLQMTVLHVMPFAFSGIFWHHESTRVARTPTTRRRGQGVITRDRPRGHAEERTQEEG